MPDSFPVLGFTPAIKIIGRTIGKILNRLYTVFTEDGEHRAGLGNLHRTISGISA